MTIKDIFHYDINRKIDGVVKVDQIQELAIGQEVREYVITKELKKHFITFFNHYNEAFSNPTADMGVWISGFFGSGKSHFLKMLSYILENKVVDGQKTVEYFREKFEDDPATFMLIDNATRNETETILFNIDIESSIKKDKTAVLRVFAKMFYNHLGFFGDNLKVALLEQYIEREGKTEEFRKAFEAKKGKPWVEQRKAFAFNGQAVVPALMETLGLSEEDAQAWFRDKNAVDFSIAQLVEDIKEYISSKPKNFRLLFMIDEVGQYVGTDTDMLLNLQSIVEKLGSECQGKVWVVCTGQEALDKIIKLRTDEFSRIQARFKTMLSLSSSSVDEVIQKRILRKKSDVIPKLEALYDKKSAEIRSLFSFKYDENQAMMDIKGYTGTNDFVKNYPFVPYQFILMQKVYTEIRRHGNAGKNLSNGERSMISGFQETVQKIQNDDEFSLIPFYRFYDTLHSSLDSSIRLVVERCQKAADAGDGIEQYDVKVLKLLYLLRYIDNDVNATIDNILILMAEKIDVDKVILREEITKSLGRLCDQNYVGINANKYNFLTDEEQDVEREIKNTPVDTSKIVSHIGSVIYDDIYTDKKFKYQKYDFAYNHMVDTVVVGQSVEGMNLKFLTVATDATEKDAMSLMALSKGEAIIVLAETRYYELIELSAKIRLYAKQKLFTQPPQSVIDIIQKKQEEANRYEKEAKQQLIAAIENAEYYAEGEKLSVKGDAKSKINQALEYLVAHVYSGLNLIDRNADTDDDITDILTGQLSISGSAPNQDAAAKVEEYLEIQNRKKLPTSMADIQSRYQAVPYGWREIDIAAVVALLIKNQKVTVKYAGNTIQPTDPKLPDMLRKKSETGKTIVKIREVVNAAKMKEAREFLREYFDTMDVPADEDGLVSFIVDKFSAQKSHFEELLGKYTGKKYPDRRLVEESITLVGEVLSQQKDNTALVTAVINKQDDLDDNKESVQKVEEFFRSQVQVYDAAAKMLDDLHNDLNYLSHEEEADKALNRIRLLIVVNTKFDYKSIPELNELMKKVREGHNKLLESKREELLEIVRQCRAKVHTEAGTKEECQEVSEKADLFYDQQIERINELESLALLDGLVPAMIHHKDDACRKIELVMKPKPVIEPQHNPGTERIKKVIKAYNRQVIFPVKKIETEEELDKYVEEIREQLRTLMKNCDGIELK